MKRVVVLTFSAGLLLASPAHAKRLSDWLLEHPGSEKTYPLGLMWEVPAEKLSQSELRFDLLQGLDSLTDVDPEFTARLRNWIDALPVTGRVPIALADPRWLQANPARDPVIHPEDTIILPLRPETVTVIESSGKLCQVVHAAGLEARDYLRKCDATSRVDYAYVAQPDGRTARYGISIWNFEKQDEPAPGAWIWAPSRDWPDSFSQKLIAFLATQGPAPDNVAAGAKEPGNATLLLRLDARLSQPILPAPKSTQGHGRDLAVTANDWGEAGLMQMPSARMRKAGDFSFSLSRVYPYTRGNVFFQPFDWLEAGFRYTSISNRLYGPVSFSGSQAYKDKSIDVKLKLLDESAYIPEMAIGVRDLAGTGLFSGEFLAASKRTGDFDWTLGLGWGNVGARGNVKNPIGSLFPSYSARPLNQAGTGNFGIKDYFKGPTSLFGGVQYQTPWNPLILKLEYDGNNYQHEGLANNQPQATPWNVGLVYRASQAFDISAGIERGNTAMLGVTLHTDLARLSTPKLDDPPRIPVKAGAPTKAPNWAVTSSDIAKQTNWHVGGITQRGHELLVTIDDAQVTYWQDYLDRAVAVLQRDAPREIGQFRFVYREHGVKVAEHVVDRNAWVATRTQLLPPGEISNAVIAQPPILAEGGNPLYKNPPPRFQANAGLNFNYSLGGPNGFLLYQVAPTVSGQLRLDDDTWMQGRVQLDVLDNFNKFTFNGFSNLPRVRTYMREYMVTSNLTMPNLQLTHVGKLTDNQYYSVYGGYLEEMYAGVGGEWLYRPFASKAAFGIDLNAVQQRSFAQDFGTRNYSTLTGHATLYWDTGWENILAKLSAGRYLAKDMGVTVDMSRVFDNGVTMGAYFSKTNVSAQQFGEGSFDKGIYITIPYDAMLTRSSGTTAHIIWKPLTRDGGAMLSRAVTLYDVTSARDNRTLEYKPAPPPAEYTTPENLPQQLVPTYTQLPETRVSPKPTAAQWESNAPDFKLKLREALYSQHFRNIKLDYDSSYRLVASLSNERIRPDGRAVGMAARIMMNHAPLDAREIKIIFAEHSEPAVVYDFFNLNKLSAYFNGQISLAALKGSVSVEYANPSKVLADPFEQFDGVNPIPPTTLADVITPDMRPVQRVGRDMVFAGQAAVQTNWLKAGAIGAGLVLGSSLLDKRADTFAQNHANNSFLKNFDSFGNALPWVEAAGAALAAVGSDDPRLSRTGYAASEAAVTSYVAVLGLKYAVGRARPWTGLGSHNFNTFAGSSSKGLDSFPSGHTIVAWSVVTPFAKEYDAPWLYGVAALTNMSRVGSRKHWVSDTVAGSLLGYGIGTFFWQASQQYKDAPNIQVGPEGVNLSWSMQ